MFRYLFRLLIVSILVLGVSSRVMAQDGTPAAEPREASRSLLQELGLPEIDVIVTDTTVAGAPTELAAGRYLVTVENLTADQEIRLLFLATPEDVSDQDALDGILGEDLPTWFWDATFAGGPTAFSGQTDTVVVELAAGGWWVNVDRTSPSDAGQPTDTATRLQVTGELPATEALANAIPILLSEYHFDLPASLVAGPQIWQLTNAGAQPHFLGLVELPEGTTTGQLTEFLDMTMTGTPAVSELGFDDVQDIYSSVIFSAGQTTWIEVDLAPGTYGVACLISDRYSQAPHAMLGMIQVFTVQ